MQPDSHGHLWRGMHVLSFTKQTYTPIAYVDKVLLQARLVEFARDYLWLVYCSTCCTSFSFIFFLIYFTISRTPHSAELVLTMALLPCYTHRRNFSLVDFGKLCSLLFLCFYSQPIIWPSRPQLSYLHLLHPPSTILYHPTLPSYAVFFFVSSHIHLLHHPYHLAHTLPHILHFLSCAIVFSHFFTHSHTSTPSRTVSRLQCSDLTWYPLVLVIHAVE
jgi:hypothetical protein